MSGRRRLDAELVRRGLVSSRSQAHTLIETGRVLVGGAVAGRPARLVSAAEPVVVTATPAQFVGRGGEKLQAALERFAIDVTGKTALDAGSSTGGFTDCLLQRGAAHVHAVDVGRGQLHQRLREDRRVSVHERTDIRNVTTADLGDRRVEVVVGDLSFISLRAVAGPLLTLAEPGGDLVLLVKPQFEAGRREAGRARGVIRDRAVWADTLLAAVSAFEAAGAAMMGAMVSPITGANGNVEFLTHLRAGSAPGGVDLADRLDLAGMMTHAARVSGLEG